MDGIRSVALHNSAKDHDEVFEYGVMSVDPECFDSIEIILVYAIEYDRMKVIKYLIDNSIYIVDVESLLKVYCSFKENNTIKGGNHEFLNESIRKGNLEMVSYLHKHGLRSIMEERECILAAIRYCRLPIIRFFLSNDYRADFLKDEILRPEVNLYKCIFEYNPSYVLTPNNFKKACMNRNAECVRYLVENGLELGDWSVIYIFTYLGLNLVKWIFERTGNDWMSQVILDGALETIIARIDLDLDELFVYVLGMGGNPFSNESLLGLAIAHGAGRIVEKLIDLGVDPKIRTSNGIAIDLAIAHCNKSMVEILIRKGADLSHLYGQINEIKSKGMGVFAGFDAKVGMITYFKELGIEIVYSEAKSQ